MVSYAQVLVEPLGARLGSVCNNACTGCTECTCSARIPHEMGLCRALCTQPLSGISLIGVPRGGGGTRGDRKRQHWLRSSASDHPPDCGVQRARQRSTGIGSSYPKQLEAGSRHLTCTRTAMGFAFTTNVHPRADCCSSRAIPILVAPLVLHCAVPGGGGGTTTGPDATPPPQLSANIWGWGVSHTRTEPRRPPRGAVGPWVAQMTKQLHCMQLRSSSPPLVSPAAGPSTQITCSSGQNGSWKRQPNLHGRHTHPTPTLMNPLPLPHSRTPRTRIPHIHVHTRWRRRRKGPAAAMEQTSSQRF